MRQKAAERDPEKRIYNETMTSKVLALANRLAATREKAADVQTSIEPLAEKEEAALAEIESARVNAKAEAERLEAEAAAKAEAALEAEARAQEKGRRDAEEEASRLKAEREAARVKAEADAAAAAAAAAAAKTTAAKAAEESAEAEKLNEAEEAKAKKATLAALVAAAAPASSDPVSPPSAAPVPEATMSSPSAMPSTSTVVEANAAALAAMLASVTPPSAPAAAPTNASGLKTRGEVRRVTRGAVELRRVLEEAAAAGCLTVVDWSIPTCGPCERIRPAYERMARDRVSVLFVGVDAAESVENRALALSAAVRAYPTFHFYVNMRRVAEITGADEARIAALVERHAPRESDGAGAGPAGASASTASASPSSESRESRSTLEMQNAIATALMTLRGSCGNLPEFVAAARALLVFVGNIVTHPGEAKYRRVRLANAAFQKKLGRHAGGVAAMEAFGFEKEGTGEECALVMSERNARHEGLPVMRRLLERAVPVLP
jgi:thioredoxin 1